MTKEMFFNLLTKEVKSYKNFLETDSQDWIVKGLRLELVVEKFLHAYVLSCLVCVTWIVMCHVMKCIVLVICISVA